MTIEQFFYDHENKISQVKIWMAPSLLMFIKHFIEISSFKCDTILCPFFTGLNNSVSKCLVNVCKCLVGISKCLLNVSMCLVSVSMCLVSRCEELVILSL